MLEDRTKMVEDSTDDGTQEGWLGIGIRISGTCM